MKKTASSILVLIVATAVGLGVVSCAGGEGTVSTLTFSNFQKASQVIGQSDFMSGSGGGFAALGLSQREFGSLYGNPFVYQGLLYLPDYDNSRVLGFITFPTDDYPAADFVLGQPDFISGTPGTGADEMGGPQTVQVYHGMLFLSEYDNSRILIWSTVPITTQAPADIVVGWPDFSTPTSGTSQTTLKGLESIYVSDGKLFAADAENNRVLIWNRLPEVSGAPADVVLGQGDFVHGASNDDNQDGVPDAGPTARTLRYPSDVWSDGNILIVADQGNNRVLMWSSMPTENFTPATLVIGQPDMTSRASGTSQDGLTNPWFLTSNGNQLFVVDRDNNRVLIWNSMPAVNQAPADVVLGQGDFVHGTRNDDNQDGVADANPTARTFDGPRGVHVYGDKLIVADGRNRRYLVFQSQ